MKKYKKLVVILGSIVLLSALLVACGGSESQNKQSSTPQPAQSQPAQTQPTTTPTPNFYKVGQAVTLQNVVEITVTKVQHLPLSQAEPGVTNEHMPKDGYFLVISVTMTNLGKEPLTCNIFNYGIRDAEGNNPPIFMGHVVNTQGFPADTVPTGGKIKGDIAYVIEAPGAPVYYFSFTGNMPQPIFWQIA